MYALALRWEVVWIAKLGCAMGVCSYNNIGVAFDARRLVLLCVAGVEFLRGLYLEYDLASI